MRLKKGIWEYKLPLDMHEIMYAWIPRSDCHLMVMLVQARDIIAMREQCCAANKQVFEGWPQYMAVEPAGLRPQLILYPTPQQMMDLKIRATKVFEI